MDTPEPSLLCVESVADLPVLWAILQRLDLPAILDRHFPATTHWKGPLTPGEVLAIWLLFLVSQGDHCLNHVQPWVEQHQGVLSTLVGKPVLSTDAHDDRLAEWLTRLGGSTAFGALEGDLNQQIIRVYQLPTDTVRIDTTTANSYAQILSEQGLLQFGHSKDDPDRPQIKIAAAVLDPLGLPLATSVVPGNVADDPLYIPAIRSVQQSLGVGGRTYVGDCKMAALDTRAYVASGGDFYLCPLSEVQLSRVQRGELLQSLWDGTVVLEQVRREALEGEVDELVAEGFGVEVELSASVSEKKFGWRERRWLVRSEAYTQAQEAGLERRLAKAMTALHELVQRKQGKKRLSETELIQAADGIVKRERVEGLLSYKVQASSSTQSIRGYGGRSRHEETKVCLAIEVCRDQKRIEETKRGLGWQVYVTNAWSLSLPQVVWAYRGQYRIEDDWSRLKGRSLGLTPLYLQDEERIQGLVYLLSLALRVLTLVEWQVRERLRQEGKKLRDVYAGQPGRQTDRPSAELLLGVRKTIRVSVIAVNGQIHVLLSPLTQVQKRLLELWNLPPDLYENIARGFPKPPLIMSEP